MKIEDYYNENYPDAKPWDELTKDERKDIKRERRRENWENIKDTLEDFTDVVDFLVMLFGRRR